MEHKYKSGISVMQAKPYEAPRVEVIEMEIEGAILASSKIEGENSVSETWDN